MDMKPHVVSDSTFYIAFLSEDEISDPDSLVNILENYNFHIGPTIHEEVKTDIDLSEHVVFHKNPYNYEDLLEITCEKLYGKGECECIILSQIIHQVEGLHAMILDDKEAREFVKNNIPNLDKYMKYSLRFIACCHCEDRTLSKEETLKILSRVEDASKSGNAPFHVTKEIISKLKEGVKGCRK